MNKYTVTDKEIMLFRKAAYKRGIAVAVLIVGIIYSVALYCITRHYENVVHSVSKSTCVSKITK